MSFINQRFVNRFKGGVTAVGSESGASQGDTVVVNAAFLGLADEAWRDSEAHYRGYNDVDGDWLIVKEPFNESGEVRAAEVDHSAITTLANARAAIGTLTFS